MKFIATNFVCKINSVNIKILNAKLPRNLAVLAMFRFHFLTTFLCFLQVFNSNNENSVNVQIMFFLRL